MRNICISLILCFAACIAEARNTFRAPLNDDYYSPNLTSKHVLPDNIFGAPDIVNVDYGARCIGNLRFYGFPYNITRSAYLCNRGKYTYCIDDRWIVASGTSQFAVNFAYGIDSYTYFENNNVFNTETSPVILKGREELMTFYGINHIERRVYGDMSVFLYRTEDAHITYTGYNERVRGGWSVNVVVGICNSGFGSYLSLVTQMIIGFVVLMFVF